MFRLIAAVLFFLIILMPVSGADDYRVFTDQQGRAIEAKILSADALKGTVTLERRDRKRVSVNPSVFCDADQQHIQQWIRVQAVLSDSMLKVSFSRKLIEKWKKDEEGKISYGNGEFEMETISTTKFERYTYEIKLENKNSFPVEDLNVQYQICYRQAEHDKDRKAVSQNKYVSGSLTIDRLDARGKQSLDTESAVVFTKEYSTEYIYRKSDPEKARGEIDGIWVRLSITTADGKTVTREVMKPDNLADQHTWQAGAVARLDGKAKGKTKKK